MTRLLLVRHGETEWNEKRLYLGRTDVPLNTRGLRQAEQLHDRLAGEPIDAVFASDLTRCHATAEAIVRCRELRVECTGLLRELELGHLEGLGNDEVAGRYPEFFELIRRHADEVIPGGESLSHVAGRAESFLSLVDGRKDADTVLVVSHSGLLRVLLCRLLGLEAHEWWRLRMDLASLTVAETYEEGAVLTLLNDTHHLDECKKHRDLETEA